MASSDLFAFLLLGVVPYILVASPVEAVSVEQTCSTDDTECTETKSNSLFQSHAKRFDVESSAFKVQPADESKSYPLIEKIYSDKECAGPDEENLQSATTAEECGKKCMEVKGDECKYFSYGKYHKSGRCWWEGSCSDQYYNQYDVYEVVREGEIITTPLPQEPANVAYDKKFLDVECDSATEENLLPAMTADECAQKCVAAKGDSCEFFVFGKKEKFGRCWWESDCDHRYSNQYDVYQVSIGAAEPTVAP